MSLLSNCEFQNHCPKPGWVEHDTAEIWESEVSNAGVLKKARSVKIIATGITNQRETSLFWEKETGKPTMHWYGKIVERHPFVQNSKKRA